MTFQAFEAVAPASDGGAVPGLLLVCDHASNAVPPEIGDLGLPPEDMGRHIAWDVGARGITLGLAETLGAQAILSTFSRLVIDPNRSERDPTLLMKLYDGSIIPGNRHADAAERERRLAAYYRPYHGQVKGALDAMEAVGTEPIIVSIHTFTPQLRGRPMRPWHVGLLWDEDDRLIRPMLDEFATTEWTVGDNQPYSGRLAGDSMWAHGTTRGIPHVLIEVRNDLVSNNAGIAAWTKVLGPIISRSVATMRLAAAH